jgi:hypothetical protein
MPSPNTSPNSSQESLDTQIAPLSPSLRKNGPYVEPGQTLLMPKISRR